MRFINHDINKALLGLNVVFLVFFIISNVYYESSIRQVTKAKNDEMLKAITFQAILEKLNDSDRGKEMALLDRELLEQKYNDLYMQNELLAKEKQTLKEQATRLQSEIEYGKAKLEGPTAQFRLIQDKNQRIRLLKEKVQDICLLLQSNGISTDECS